MKHLHRLAMALCALAWAAAPARAADLTLALSHNPGSLPIFVAQARGLFEAQGLTVHTLNCALGKQCLRMVLDGKAQIGTVADLPIALAGFGEPAPSVIATINTNRNDTKLITRRGSGITQVADLAGHTVGTYMGTTAHYALDSQLLLNGVDSGKVKVQALQVGEERTRLQDGTVDAVAVVEPFAYELTQLLGNEAVQLNTLRVYNQTWNLVTAAAPTRPSNEHLAALLRALDQACQIIKAEPAYAKGLLAKRSALSEDMINRNWSTLEFEISLKQALLSTLEGQARWALRLNLVKGQAPNYLRLIHSQPLRAAQPGQVTLAE